MFKPEQLEWYASYEKVRQSGLYNMFDRRAQTVAQLSTVEYYFVRDNFSALQKAHTEAEEDAHILAQAEAQEENE